MTRPWGFFTAVIQECFDSAIFKGVKRHHHQATARRQNSLSRRQSFFQLTNLVIHINAKRLEYAGCGMNMVLMFTADNTGNHAR